MNDTTRLPQGAKDPRSRQVRRFNQKYTVLSRTAWDPRFQQLKEHYQQRRNERIHHANLQTSYALRDASWYVANTLGTFAGFMHGNDGLYSWTSLDVPSESLDTETPDKPVPVSDAPALSQKVKEAARFYGADLVGIAKVNGNWIYSHAYNRLNGQNDPVKLPTAYRFAIVLAIEMDPDQFLTSEIGASAATGLGYSKMAFVSSLLAEYVRNLGYHALPCGNDTALSIPLAIDAGLGELGRNGLLITPQLGPRVRLCKVLTDLPLQPATPRTFGIQAYCHACRRCVESCPVQAISERQTMEAPTISNNSGALKWPVDGEKCFAYWCEQGFDCSVCIQVCPFNERQ